jgi:pyruvate dehydrogenase (quinone)
MISRDASPFPAHSRTLASMAAAIPAKFAHPQRIATALVGTAAMQMNGLNELITIMVWRK